MSTTITCPHCQHVIQIDEALKQEFQDKILKQAESKYQAEIARLQQQKITEIEDIKKQAKTQARQEAITKVREEYDAKIAATKEEAEERQKQVKDMQEQIKELLKQLRESKNSQDKLEIEYQKKLMEDEAKIKHQAKQEAEEELNLKMAAKDKQLIDLEKQLHDAQRKIQQGSQQMQGEVLELKLEEKLRAEFPFDQIGEVPKGIRGADVWQGVCTNSGAKCGSIIWESKNTKSWSPGWIAKLKNDQRQLKAEVAVIVSTVLPQGMDSFGLIEGVWVVRMKDVVSLAYALRQQLIMVNQTKLATQGKATKAEIVYDYLISNEFKQRIEVWVEYFNDRRETLEKEKRYFMKKWESEEKSIFRVMQNTAGIYGDLQGLIGSALPKVQSLELPEEI